ncbi:MAG TPA: exodeoxyribonuclease V subunit gamma [Segeticoccus sp.]|uniref:exodeoxyribonuclease V subunit gamma n=1 Tax=Segeticoccus sp. TaxID=2706531 RepID=UPI002D7E8ABF|nr:exodeoxyribonuclease V subunit gamma [Segeticoccus sp.]HET8598798.1 exodeoxyribonuclease V subunit gamma [Segeticoccus sp.]
MTLFVHRATSTDVLADGLAELLAAPLADPFAEEVVAVPAKGVERWLAQRLSHRLGAGSRGEDGVCAGVRFLNPHSLVALVLGVDRDDPWHPDRLAWPVLRAIDESLGQRWAATLAQHLGHGERGEEGDLKRGRRYSVARRLAGLFSSYAVQRPAMVADWRGGGSGDGLGGTVDDDLAWQPELWRRVLDLVDDVPPDLRQARVVDRLEQGGPEADDLDLPGRLSLFGHTRVAGSEVAVLRALGTRRDVHLWLPQASPAAWDEIADAVAAGPVPRRADSSSTLVHHPLLASLGRDGRELQRTLAVAGADDRPIVDVDQCAVSAAPATRTAQRSMPEGSTRAPGALLGWLQDDLRTDHPPTPAERARRVADAADRSIQVHACHGQSRQVEVLREVLTGLLQDDPTLEPRDILVMCPDIDAYAPLVHAGFGLGEVVNRAGDRTVENGAGNTVQSHPAHRLRVRLADRAPRHTNPLLGLADRLVVLAGGRLTASEVLDLVRSEPVRHRFRLDDDDLDRVGDWVDQVVIRWGLDEEHRGDFQLQAFAQNTWRSGLDRVLVGAVLDGQDHDHLGTTLGLDDVDSGDLDLAGRLVEVVDRLGATLHRLRECRAAREWTEALREGVLGLADVGPRETWQLAQLERELARLEAAATAEGGNGRATALGLADVHALFGERLAGRATRANFRTGTLTVCTIVPMRSVPHRVVCLVGLDDGVFPRSTTPDGDDVLARTPVTGERDARSEDRQLLLDAIMSTRETVVITYTGADEHTGAERPPAVPLGELIDAVRATATGPAVDHLIRRHPLQPYDERNLGAPPADEPPLLPDGTPFSFDPAALAGARAALAERTEPFTLTGTPLEPAHEGDVDLDELIRFLLNPAHAYLRQRLGLLLPEVPEERAEGIPIELDGLEKWAIGDRVLRGVLAGRSLASCCDAEQWRGELPPGMLGRRTLEEVVGKVKRITGLGWQVMGCGGPEQPAETRTVDVDVDLPDGRRLTGTATGLVGDRAVTVTYSTLRAKQRLQSWVLALALAAGGHQGTSSHVVGQLRQGRLPGVGAYRHGPLPPEDARRLLGELVALRDRGLCEPLPMPVATACAFAESFVHEGDTGAALRAADLAWATRTGAWSVPGDQDDTACQRVYGGTVPLHTILGEPATDERWFDGVSSRLGQLALRVWQPVLTLERADGSRVEERTWVRTPREAV